METLVANEEELQFAKEELQWMTKVRILLIYVFAYEN